ncbi:MAG: class I SAM-dependent methyltransferase [Nanoarchaeota archaeon]|nr:class I SAM-dependent methyltransferase [Nanoarchaeota archaeon]
MDKKEYETLFNLEEKYWWFVGQRSVVTKILQQHYATRKDLSLLDVGCGTGINITMLQQFGNAHGCDIATEAMEFCQQRGLEITKSDVMNLKFFDKTFDVVTALGLFYHKAVTNDVKGMKEIYRVLNPGGRLIIFDCAMMSLYGKHDLAFHGIRRYSKQELQEKLEQSGFIVEKISYCNTLLFPFIFLKRKLEKFSSAPATSEVQDNLPPWINSLLTKIYLWESKGVHHFNYPVGINIVAVGRKKE